VVAAIKLDRQHGTLASAIRLFVLGFYLKQGDLRRHLAGLSGTDPEKISQGAIT
jgi:hypothetical protein